MIENATVPSADKAATWSSAGKTLFWALLLAFAAAWVSQAFVYIPVADDFPLQLWANEKGVLGAFLEYFQKTGIRRSFQTFIWIPLYLAPSEWANFWLLALHLVATVVLFYLLARISLSALLAYAGAVIFGVFPFTFGAVTWISGAYVMPNAIFFLGATLVVVIHAVRPKRTAGTDWLVAAVAGVLVFLSCLTGEHTVFAGALVGIFGAALSRDGIGVAELRRPYVFAPVLTVGAYLGLTLLTQSGSGLTGIKGEEISLLSNFNPETIVSVWYYQWRHLSCLEPWFYVDALSLTLHEMSGWRLWTGLASLAASVLLLRRAGSMPDAPCAEHAKQKRPQSWSPVLVIILMMLGISFVHALAGGYSAQSRHQYMPLALVTMLVAALARCMPMLPRIVTWRKCTLPVVATVLGVLTTWMVTSINRYELRSYTALCEYIAGLRSGGPVTVRYEPPLYHLWPSLAKMVPSHSYEAEWVLNESIVSGHGAKPIQLGLTGGPEVAVIRNISLRDSIIVRDDDGERDKSGMTNPE
jgi:hypothetical protein